MSGGEADRAPLVKRNVVSCFIFWKPPKGVEKVALFRRSSKVSTYRHHWAPISGTIEASDPSPLAAAWREMQEETTLTPASGLSLHHAGQPYTFSDAALGREWTIHPFAFQLLAPGGSGQKPPSDLITIDWEHEGWRWFDPADVRDDDGGAAGDVRQGKTRPSGFGGVPRLAQSLQAVWLVRELGETAAGTVHSALARLRGDHASGARALAGIALDAFRDVLRNLPAPVLDKAWLDRATTAVWTLWKHGRPSMDAAIVNVLVAALRGLEGAVRTGGGRRKEDALAVIDALKSQRAEAAWRISKQLSRYVTELCSTTGSGEQDDAKSLKTRIVILTLSSSGTILESLKALLDNPEGPKVVDIRILESRPLFEGADMAAALLKHTRMSHTIDVKVSVYTDAAVGLAATDVDILLLGADRIGVSGAVSNKTGSLAAAVVTKHIHPRAQVVVLSETEKIALPGPLEHHPVEENDPSEVTNAWSQDTRDIILRGMSDPEHAHSGNYGLEVVGANVVVNNVYFEWVPAEVIKTYICEGGQLTIHDIKTNSIFLEEVVSRLFPQLRD